MMKTLLAVLLLAAATPQALAHTQASSDDASANSPTASVYYGDLNLSDPAGVVAMHKRRA